MRRIPIVANGVSYSQMRCIGIRPWRIIGSIILMCFFVAAQASMATEADTVICAGGEVLPETDARKSLTDASCAEAPETVADTLSVKDSSMRTVTRTFKKEYSIFFRINRWNIDTAFMDNGATIRRMNKEIDSLLSDGTITADSIDIESAASPDGGNAFNIWLSKKRGLSTLDMLRRHYPDIDPEIMFIDPMGEDWSTFRKVVYEDENIPSRDELIALMESDMDNDAKEKELRRMNTAFRYILKHHIYLMRSSLVTFNVSEPMVMIGYVGRAPGDRLETAPGSILSRPAAPQRPETKKMILAARTNLLVPALNVGLEVPVGYNWSIGADYYFPWWLARSNKYCMEMLGWFVDTKYWFGKDRGEKEKLTGHAIGGYAGFGYYDYQWEQSGNQGEYIDIGVDYTYSIPLAKDKLRMEFNIGLGWIFTVARHYTPTDDYTDLIKDPGIRHRRYNFFGPTRASVSLVVPIRVKVKGGAR